jgi:hypothetical protein
VISKGFFKRKSPYSSSLGKITTTMFLSALKTNHTLQAMIIPAALGALFGCLDYLGKNIVRNYIMAKLYASVTIHNSEAEYFDAVIDFIQDQQFSKTSHLVAFKSKTVHQQKSSSTDVSLHVQYQPEDSGSVILLKYKDHLLYFSRTSGQTVVVGSDNKMIKIEKLYISTLFSANAKIIQDLIAEAIEDANRKAKDHIRIFEYSGSSWRVYEWTCTLYKKPRWFDSVVLDRSVSVQLVEDVHIFLRSKEWYARMNIPYRRGYLLHGPPGCGKTSFCHALASKLKLDICLLDLSDSNLNDSSLTGLIRNAPLRSLVILEDVDSVFIQRDIKSGECRQSNVSFSGLLNAIDGISSQEGRILIMTTNHMKKLDPALLRPGRCDVKITFCNASHEQLATMFLRFFPESQDNAIRFADSLPAGKFSLAQVQAHLVRYRHSDITAVEEASQICTL